MGPILIILNIHCLSDIFVPSSTHIAQAKLPCFLAAHHYTKIAMASEKWAETVRPQLTDPTYLATASYEELRLAIRIIGIRVTVYPTKGDWPYRYQIEVTVPDVLKKLNCIAMQPYMSRYPRGSHINARRT